MKFNRKSKIQIFETNNYNIFKFLPGNRNVDEKHVDELVCSISEKDLKNPIVVNEDYEIIDGQHTLEARRKLCKTVYYIIQEKLGINDVILANNHSRIWKLEDFIKSYADRGFDDYQKIYKLTRESTSFTSLAIGAMLLEADYSIEYTYKRIRAGNFKVKSYDDALKKIKHIEKYKNYINKRIFSKTYFMTALIRMMLHDKFSHSKMLSRCKSSGGSILPQTSMHQYMDALEEFYNKGTVYNLRINFVSDYHKESLERRKCCARKRI